MVYRYEIPNLLEIVDLLIDGSDLIGLEELRSRADRPESFLSTILKS